MIKLISNKSMLSHVVEHTIFRTPYLLNEFGDHLVFMWTFTRSVKIHILRSCSFPDWDVNFRDNSCQRFRKLSRVFGKSEVLEGVNVKLDVNPGNELPTRRHKESITHAKYLTFINLYICMAFD